MCHSKITIFLNFSLVYKSVIESNLEVRTLPPLLPKKRNNVNDIRPLTSTIESPGTD